MLIYSQGYAGIIAGWISIQLRPVGVVYISVGGVGHRCGVGVFMTHSDVFTLTHLLMSVYVQSESVNSTAILHEGLYIRFFSK